MLLILISPNGLKRGPRLTPTNTMNGDKIMPDISENVSSEIWVNAYHYAATWMCGKPVEELTVDQRELCEGWADKIYRLSVRAPKLCDAHPASDTVPAILQYTRRGHEFWLCGDHANKLSHELFRKGWTVYPASVQDLY